MPMPDNTNGSLIMTTNSGERSSFSTPFISEFNDIQNKYWQYFELVIANNDYKENKNNIEFRVRIQDKDYTSDEKFNKVVELYFHYSDNYSSNILEVNYYNNGINVTKDRIRYTLNTIVSNYITVLGFLINPTSYEMQDPVFEEYDNERYFTMTLFVNYRIELSNEIKIPVSLTNNWSITLDTESTNETSNVVYQWNFDNSRFIYKDLAYQCYEDLTTLYTVSDFKYLPTYFNLPREVSNQDSNMICIFPFVANTNEDFTKMRLELVCDASITNAIYTIILGDFEPNTYFFTLQSDEEIKNTEVGEALEITIDMVKDTFTIDYTENDSRINLASVNMSEFSNLLNGMFVISIILDTTIRKMYFNAKSGLDLGYDNMPDGFGPFYKSDETYFRQLDFDLDHLNFIKKSLITWPTIVENNYAINFGTKPYYLVFDDIESIEDIYNSPNNIYWKSLFQYNYTYPFSKPFLNNQYILPYDFSDRNNNIYMEVSIENKVQDVTYYIYIGSGYKVADSGVYDEQALLLDEYTGFLVTIKNTHLIIYRYYNGKQEIASNYELDNDTIAFEFIENLISSFNFGYNVQDNRYNFSNFNIIIDNVRSDLKSVVLHAIPDDHSLTDLGSIRINFGPDGLYARYLDEIKEYDNYNKSFNYDMDDNDLTLLMYTWQLGFYGNKTTDEEWFTVANPYYLEENAPEYWSLKFINPTTFGKKVFGYGVNNEVIGDYGSDFIDENYTSYPNDTEPQENMNISNVYYTQPLDLVHSLDSFYMEIDIIDNNDALYKQNIEAGTYKDYWILVDIGDITIEPNKSGPNNEYPNTIGDENNSISFNINRTTNGAFYSHCNRKNEVILPVDSHTYSSISEDKKTKYTVGYGLKNNVASIFTDITGTWEERKSSAIYGLKIAQSENCKIVISFTSPNIPGYLIQQYTDNLELRVKFWNFSHRDTASIYYPILATS